MNSAVAEFPKLDGNLISTHFVTWSFFGAGDPNIQDGFTTAERGSSA